MTLFALLILTVQHVDLERNTFQIVTQPVGLYRTQKECQKAQEALQIGLPKSQSATCTRANGD